MFERRHIQLSGAGAARRAAMLGELIEAMQAHHARRRIRRRTVLGVGAAALTLIATYFIVNAAPTPAPAPMHVAHLETMPAPVVTASFGTVAHIARVETVPGIAERYKAEATHIVKRIGDRELLDTLHAVDRPAGLVRMGEKVFVTASVTDQPAPFERPDSL